MKNVKMIISVLLTGFGYVVGGWDIAIKLLLIAIACDYISGLIAAFINDDLSSKKGFKGILKKVLYLMVVAVGVIIDKVVETNGAIRELVIYYFLSNECLSIIENAAACGLPVPEVLKSKLAQIQGSTPVTQKQNTVTSNITPTDTIKQEVKE